MRNERGRRLREFLQEDGKVFGYEYDFGNSWEEVGVASTEEAW